MKKIISLLLVCIVFICACGKNEDKDINLTEDTTVKEEGYYLDYNGHKLVLDKEFNTNDYGEYDNMFENEACAFGERDVTYFYKDIEIETYGGKTGGLTVYSIRIVSDDGKTNEGIGLYDLIDDAISKYGDNYQKDDNIYKYTRGNTALIFVTENDLIKSIEYRVANLG